MTPGVLEGILRTCMVTCIELPIICFLFLLTFLYWWIDALPALCYRIFLIVLVKPCADQLVPPTRIRNCRLHVHMSINQVDYNVASNKSCGDQRLFSRYFGPRAGMDSIQRLLDICGALRRQMFIFCKCDMLQDYICWNFAGPPVWFSELSITGYKVFRVWYRLQYSFIRSRRFQIIGYPHIATTAWKFTRRVFHQVSGDVWWKISSVKIK